MADRLFHKHRITEKGNKGLDLKQMAENVDKALEEDFCEERTAVCQLTTDGHNRLISVHGKCLDCRSSDWKTER